MCIFLAGAPGAAEVPLETQIKQAVQAKDLEKAVLVLAEMQKLGGTPRMEAVLACVKAIPPDEDMLYWGIVRGATGFLDRASLRLLGETICKLRGSPISRDLMFGLQGNTVPAVVETHALVLAGGEPDLARMAAEQLANLPGEPSVAALIGAFATQRSPGVRQAVGLSLELLTDQRFAEDGELWKAWFEGGKREGLVRDSDGRIRRAGDDVYREAERQVLQKTAGKVLVLTATKIYDTPEDEKTEEERSRERALANDQIENIIRAAGIPCDVMEKVEFNEKRPNLSAYMAVAVNCTQIREVCCCLTCQIGSVSTYRMHKCAGCKKHDLRSFALDDRGAGHLQDYVENLGGYLFTEDWGLIEVLEPSWGKIVTAFPGPATNERVTQFLAEQDVDVNPVRGETSNPLMRGVYSFHHAFSGGGGGDETTIGDGGESSSQYTPALQPVDTLYHEWHIDNESPAIQIQNPKAVKVLLRSQYLRKGASGNDACAITFFPGKNGRGVKAPVITDGDGSDSMAGVGRVLHILSHFGKQKDVSDEAAIQNLLLNFIRESAVAYNRMYPAEPQKK